MKIEISFNTENAAFEDNFEAELLHIMRRVSDKVDYVAGFCRELPSKFSILPFTLFDSNGNTIGTVTFSQD